MENMVSRRGHAWIQNRWDREHHGIGGSIDAALPVPDPHHVNWKVVEAAGIKAQMQVQK